ncbi:hypothetical protein ACSDZP_004967, partial [Escherichia coli]
GAGGMWRRFTGEGILTDSRCLEKIALSIGFRAKLFGANNLGWFPINPGLFIGFRTKNFGGKIFCTLSYQH